MKTVIEMVREAGGVIWSDRSASMHRIELERFAELVRADERKAMMQLFTDPENQPTQHGTVTVKYMEQEMSMMEEHCAELILTEREACAGLRKGVALVGKWPTEYEDGFWDALEKYEDLIRERGNT